MLLERQKANLTKLLQKYNFNYLKLPPEVYEIVIPENQYFIDLGKGKRRRRIYYRVAYQQNQQTHIKQVRQKLRQYQIFEKFPDQAILKQLYGAQFDVDKTMERLVKLQSYHNDPIVTNFTKKTLQFLQKGCIYTYGKDKGYRPIIVIQANQWNYDFSSEENYNIIYFMMLVVFEYLMVPYHVQKYILIFNLENMGLSEIPYTAIFDLLAKMNLYYTGNMDKVLVYNTQGLGLFLKILNPFIPQHARKKIKFVQPGKQSDVLQYIDPYELQQKFGGTLPNLSQYWPPKSTSQSMNLGITHRYQLDTTSYHTLVNNSNYFQDQSSQCQCNGCSCKIF